MANGDGFLIITANPGEELMTDSTVQYGRVFGARTLAVTSNSKLCRSSKLELTHLR